MQRAMIWCVSLVVWFLAVQAARADSLAEVKKKIDSQVQQCQTLRQEARMTMDMAGPAGKMSATSTIEFARRDKDKWLSRSDMVMTSPKAEGQAGPEQMKMTVLFDGQHLYSISEKNGKKMAVKMRADQGNQKTMTEPTGIAGMEKHYNLRLLSDQKVSGKDCWVIEAKTKQTQGQPGGFDRIMMYYDQTSCLLTKSVSYDKAGKVVSTMEVTKSQTNVKIPDDRFVLPAGVQVTDMTRGMPGMVPPSSGNGNSASPDEAQE